MKRIILLLPAVVVATAVFASSAIADVHVSVNVVPYDQLDLSQGGEWSIVAKSDTPDSDGIVALVTQFVTGTMPVSPLQAVVNPNINHWNPITDGTELLATDNGVIVDYLYAQDPFETFLLGVGLPGGPSDVGADFLGESFWDNSSEIAFGTISDLTNPPIFDDVGANEIFEILGGQLLPAEIGLTVVRFIPEPSSALMTLSCFACCAWRRRRE